MYEFVKDLGLAVTLGPRLRIESVESTLEYDLHGTILK